MHADIYACDGWNLKINWVGSFDLRVNKSLCKVFFFCSTTSPSSEPEENGWMDGWSWIVGFLFQQKIFQMKNISWSFSVSLSLSLFHCCKTL